MSGKARSFWPISIIAIQLVVSVMTVGYTPVRPSSHPGKAEGLLLEWEAPPYLLTPVVGDDGHTYTRIKAAGTPNSAPPGWPHLPVDGKLVALPPSGEFGLELIEVTYETVPLDYPVEPAPAPAIQRDTDGEPLPGDWVFEKDEAAYTSVSPFPAQPATFGNAVWMRDHRLARLTFSPFRYRPALGTLDVVRRLRLRVWWESPPAITAMVSVEEPIDPALSNLVINPSDLVAFRAPARTTPLDHSDAIPTWQTVNADQRASATYKVIAATEGIFALDQAALEAAGLPVAEINPATLQLWHAGTEVAAHWEGDSDVLFEAGERLLFYARPQPTRYAGFDVYWLSWGGDVGQRMTSRSGAPGVLPAGTAWATAHVEENVEYDWVSVGHDGDHWFWSRLKLPDLVNATFDIPVETPDPDTSGQLRVWLRSFTSASPKPDHHVSFSVNGTYAGEVYWEGETVYTATLDLPAGLLQAGPNSVGLSLPGDTGSDVEGIWVDAIAIKYGLKATSGHVARFSGQSGASAYTIDGFSNGPPHVYDITDPIAPRVVTDFTVTDGQVSVGDGGATPAEYLILTDDGIMVPQAIVPAKSVSEPDNGADYVIISHPDFLSAVQPLITHRASQGLRVAAVDVEAIYDQFGDGRMDPEAIRSFLSHAYGSWPGPALRYVVLVGDGTYDPRHYRPDSNPTYLPPYLADVDPEWSETASDNRYADLTGDPLPELLLGRFPVNSSSEVEAIIDKIIYYETNPPTGGWNRRLVFGADNPSPQGNHHFHADAEFSTYATPAYGNLGTRVYLSETTGAPHLFTDAETAQNALISTLNRGALLYTYFGHSSWHQEAVLETDNYAPLFHRDHIARLNNRGRWPVVLHMTCLTGRYVHRTSDTLDESLLRTKDVGAVAVWGPSGSGVATGHQILHRSFYGAVFDDRETELGSAIQTALVSLYTAGIHNDLIETYHLFGDPALALALSSVDLPFSVFLPIIAPGS